MIKKESFKRVENILLISNMYPSKEDYTYGIFVKNFEEQIIKNEFTIAHKCVISGRGKNTYEKIQKYINFFKQTIYSTLSTKYDLIYVHYIGHSLLPLLFIKNKIKKPLILNAHGSDVLPNTQTGKFIQKLVTPVIKKATMIVVPSNYFKDIVHNKFNIDKSKIFISPSGGIDTNLFRPFNKYKENNELIIGYVSRIDQGKGWDILLQAIKLLIDEGHKTFKVLLIGGGSQEKQLLKMIKVLKLENNTTFIGKVSHQDLVHYYNNMNIFVFPTIRSAESLGLVGLEAMACGIPVIGSNIGGLKGYIKNGYNGELFEAGNINQLSKIIKKFILMNKQDLQNYSKHSVATAAQYDSNVISKHLSNKLKLIIKNN